MLVQAVFVLCLFGLQLGSAQVEFCKTGFPEECECDHAYEYIMCLRNYPTNSTWDIKGSFDKVSESISNDSVIVRLVYLLGEDLVHAQEVPANSISRLKAQHFSIEADFKFSYINPDAFPSIYKSAETLSLYEMILNPQEAFNLFNKFEVLHTLFLQEKIQLTEVPDNAFTSNPAALKLVYLDDVELQSIGSKAFFDLPKIEFLNLEINNLTLEGISDSAFEFSAADVMINIKQNPGLTHLAEEKFQKFLDDGHTLVVGPPYSNPWMTEYCLHCDERMNWFCDGGYTEVIDYICKEEQYENIFDYCTQNFETYSYDEQNYKKRVNAAKAFEAKLGEQRGMQARHHPIRYGIDNN